MSASQISISQAATAQPMDELELRVIKKTSAAKTDRIETDATEQVMRAISPLIKYPTQHPIQQPSQASHEQAPRQELPSNALQNSPSQPIPLQPANLQNKQQNTQQASPTVVHKKRFSQIHFHTLSVQYTLTDADSEACCLRVMSSTIEQAREKCSSQGLRVWRAGSQTPRTDTPPEQTMGRCYLNQTKGLDKSTFFQCTARANAKCYDPTANDPSGNTEKP